jgi:DNA polymerase delta subunit 2
MYFLRLQQLKKTVKQRAEDAWHDFELGGQTASFVERVLDVRQGELCWVVGTVYMEMAEKPNVLNDIEKDVCFSTQKRKRQLLTLRSTG